MNGYIPVNQYKYKIFHDRNMQISIVTRFEIKKFAFETRGIDVFF